MVRRLLVRDEYVYPVGVRRNYTTGGYLGQTGDAEKVAGV
jgi:hypothetical protein